MANQPPEDGASPEEAGTGAPSSDYLGVLPDADRISSVETVRQYVEEHLRGIEPQAYDTTNDSVSLTALTPSESFPASSCIPRPNLRRSRNWHVTRGATLDAAPKPRYEQPGVTEAEDSRTCPWFTPQSPGPGQRTIAEDQASPGHVSPINDRYVIIKRLATGGMAEIYHVRHRSLGKELALKLIQKSNTADETHLRQLFLREARLVSRLDHPHIVTVTDFGVDPERGEYIVMELLRGETLYQRLHRLGRLKVHTALEIGLQVAEALHHMHVQGVIHCDVKAENVFLCRPQADSKRRIAVKLIDFGLSRLRATGVALQAGQVGGTPQYMAPELIQGAVPQPSMDIYALGVLLFEMLTGTVPFDGANRLEILKAHMTETPSLPSPLTQNPLQSRIEEIIMTALSKTPQGRQRSMGQVIFQLRTLIQMDGLPAAAKVRRHTPGEQPALPLACRDLVEGSPLPQFQLDAKGRILYANRSFYTFVKAHPETIRGTPIGDTRLGLVYPSVQTDAESCAKRRRGEPLKRAFTFVLTDGTVVSMLCWMCRREVAPGKAPMVLSYIHPLS